MRCKNFKFKEKCLLNTSSNYSTHGIHSYTAKFIPHIPRYFIKKYTKKKDVVLDPFAGSGTTLLEANILGRNSLGIDINPLAILIGKVKTTPIKRKKLEEATKKLFKNLDKKPKFQLKEFPNIDYWFNKKSIIELSKIDFMINQLYKKREISRDIWNYFRVCFSSIVRKSSFADPHNPKTYCSPRMQVLRKQKHQFDPIKYFKTCVTKNSGLIYKLGEILKDKKVKTKFITTNDTRNIKLPSNIKKIDLIITSPPIC